MLRLTTLEFLSTPSARRATPGFEQLLHDLHHFYPRPPRGGRQHRQRQTVWKDVFLSTPSARRATFPLVGDVGDHLISIHALREEGDPRLYRGTADAGDFYPRPPRGGRLEQQAAMSYNSAISIHALREEGDARTRAIMCLTFTFLSTPSARRATTAYQRQTCSDTDFYPRPPRGGRLDVLSLFGVSLRFLSTPSARRATTTTGQMIAVPDNFYPRPPRGGRRLAPVPRFALRINFYPRPPRGGRQAAGDGAGLPGQFLSTPSARRATCSASRGRAGTAYFYPRPPRGGRLVYALHAADMRAISIHALREEGDIFCV